MPLSQSMLDRIDQIYTELYISAIGGGSDLYLTDLGQHSWGGTGADDGPRVIRWDPIRFAIDPLSPDIGRTETSVVVADPDGQIRSWLTGKPVRGSQCQIYWRTGPPNSLDDDYDVFYLYTGILDSWTLDPGRVTLKMKSDDRWLRTYVPRVKILKSEFADLTGSAQEYWDTYVPLVYGAYDSTGLGQFGMIPAIPIKTTAGATAVTGNSYVVALGPLASSKVSGTTAVLRGLAYYKNGAAITPGTNDTFGTTIVGGKTITVLYFGTTTATDGDVITVDVEGAPDEAAGTVAVSNPVTQLRDFLVDHVFNEYKSGEFPHAGLSWFSYFETQSWGECEAVAQSLQLRGSLYVGGSKSQRQVRDVIAEWLQSFPMFRLYLNRDNRLAIKYINLKHPGYSDETADSQVVLSDAVLGDSYRVDLDAYNVVDRISSDHTYSELAGPLRSFEVQDMNLGENTRESVQLINSPREV